MEGVRRTRTAGRRECRSRHIRSLAVSREGKARVDLVAEADQPTLKHLNEREEPHQ